MALYYLAAPIADYLVRRVRLASLRLQSRASITTGRLCALTTKSAKHNRNPSRP